ncbi:MAG: pentapeptide repeat-containing protein [Cyanobacteriota bacterium]|nr:pentapeptide repeat-containing protein [Cyanobacteriota bacterium]
MNQTSIKTQTISHREVNSDENRDNLTLKHKRYKRNNWLNLIRFGVIPLVLAIFFGYSLQKVIENRRNSDNILIAQRQENSYAKILKPQKLDNQNLNSHNIEVTKLGNFVLPNIKLETADIKLTNLEGAYLSDANLQGFNLKYANIFGAYLVGANLQNANLESTNLIGTNLQNANLKDANFKDAEFGCIKDSHVRNLCTDLRNAKGLTPEQVKQAKNWQSGIYSPGFRAKLGLPQ